MAENNEFLTELKKKIIFSNLSDAEITVVDSCSDLTEEQLNDETKAFFDGMTLIDNAAEQEDDISQVCSLTKDRKRVNLQDYYSDNGAYDDSEQFLEAIKNLMDKEYYINEGIDFYECDDLDEDEKEFHCDKDGNAIFEENITEIKENEFSDSYDCDSLKTAVIPEGVKNISSEAFMFNSNIKRISFPTTLESIADGAFKYCYSLESLNIPGNIKKIGEDAFHNCENLISVVLQEGIETIKTGAFKYCEGLRDVVFPKSLVSIGESAFSLCENLESVTIPKKCKVHKSAFEKGVSIRYFEDIE